MYYVNEEQIYNRLSFIPQIVEVLKSLEGFKGEPGLVHFFAQERAMHLAIEVITDVGSLMIDGFLMRDASSYEDIVEILGTEGVIPAELSGSYLSLIGLRKLLTQQYNEIDRTSLREDLSQTAELLKQFVPLVTNYVKKELQGF